MGELHLEIIVDRMKREFGVVANVGAPQVAYRETIRKDVSKPKVSLSVSLGGRGQYGHVWLRLFQNEKGKGFEFINSIKGGVVPGEYIKPVEEESRKLSIMVLSPVIRLLMSKSSSTTAVTTKLTLVKWPSKLPVRWAYRTV